MFDHRQYVPVLRWKSSERAALCKLDTSVKKRITPIFEFVPLDFEDKSPTSVLGKQAKQIAECWGWSDLFFADFCLLGDKRATNCVPIFSKEAQARNLRVGFVSGLHWPDAYQTAVKAAVKKTGRELCFRISGYELRQGALAHALDKLLDFFEKDAADVHLVVDFQSLSEPLPNIAVFTNSIPHLEEWQSFAVVSGAFPKDLADIKKNSQHEQPRSDWLMWKDLASSTKRRVPSFGDYAIRHALFEENEGKGMNFSASIRYTASDYWVIMRGEGVKNENGSGFAQFPAQAELLRCREEFCGPQCCAGCLYIDSMAQQFTKSGHLKNWLEATFNHHLTFVVRRLDNFFAGSKNGIPLFESSPGQHTLQA